MPISKTQLTLLRAAARLDDGLLPRPDRLAGAALARIEVALTRAGLVEPAEVDADQPRWRETEGKSTGLRITVAGRDTAGLEVAPTKLISSDETVPGQVTDGMAQELDDPARGEAGAFRQPRSGTKAAGLVAMLLEPEGASLDALATALAWQPHTVRAALTRLRQSGLAVTTSKEAGRPTTYRIVAAGETEAAPADAGMAG